MRWVSSKRNQLHAHVLTINDDDDDDQLGYRVFALGTTHNIISLVTVKGDGDGPCKFVAAEERANGISGCLEHKSCKL